MKRAEIAPPSEFSKRFAAHLSRLVDDAGVTQAGLASDLGRTQAYVSERLRGVRAPDTDLIAAVAARLNTTPRLLAAKVLAGIKADAARDELPQRRKHRAVSEVEPNLSDLYNEPSAAEPERRDVEGDEEPEQP